MNFVHRSLAGLRALFRESLHSEEVSRAGGLLQKLDARVKVATFLAWIILATALTHAGLLLSLYLLTVWLAWRSRIRLIPFLARTWLFIPLFTAIMALPALFNVVTPGEPIWTLLRLSNGRLAVTRQGLASFDLLVLRVATAVSWTTLLTLTTRWDRLLNALQVFRIPKTFILVLGLMHRYLHVLTHQAEETYLAIQSRVVGAPSGNVGRQLVTVRIGAILRKSLNLSQEVYQAMAARGYTGEVHLSDPPHLHQRDYVWMGTSAILLAGYAGAVLRGLR